jgi:hypothetical protein
MRIARGVAVVAVAAAALTPAGCGSDRTAGVRDVAGRFYTALRDGDGATACGLLAPDTVSELEDSARSDCSEAVLDAAVPAPGRALDARVFGDQAQLRSESDTAFAAEFGDGWRITAAGCEPQGERPYECAVKGD